MLVNHSQVYTVLLDAKITGFGFNVLISKLETSFSKSADVLVGSKIFHELVANLNSFHPSGQYFLYRNMLIKRCCRNVLFMQSAKRF